MRSRLVFCVALVATVLITAVITGPGAGADGDSSGRGRGRVAQPTLVKRATLSADFLAPGPPSGAMATPANGRTGPFAGQVIPGFSGMIDNRDGTFWAMPDNGFGAKNNSADFLLRLYRVRPHWETARGGDGAIEVGNWGDRCHLNPPASGGWTPRR
jgi:glycerophosphoryl diester phosphodiesterase